MGSDGKGAGRSLCEGVGRVVGGGGECVEPRCVRGREGCAEGVGGREGCGGAREVWGREGRAHPWVSL